MNTDKVQNLISKLLKVEFIRFGIVGVIATAIHYGLYLLLKELIGLNVAYTIGYLISLACNFLLSARFTFKADASVRKGIGFIASHVVNYFLHMLLLNLFIRAGIASGTAPIFVYCIAIPVNFLLVRFVFRRF